MPKIILFSNTAWYLYNHRLTLARAIRAAGMQPILVSPPDEYAQKLVEAGFEWRPIQLVRHGTNPLHELISFMQILRLYKAEQAQIIHHFTVKPVLYGTIAARLAGKAGVVNSITGQGFLFVNQSLAARLLRSLVRPLYRLALGYRRSLTVFQNPIDKRSFLARGYVDEEQTVLIPGSGVDLNRFALQPEPEGIPVVMLASRLLWDKGIDEFIGAVRLLRERKIKARFVLVGEPDEGNPASIAAADIHSWEQEGLVEYWGQRDDMPVVITASHVIVLPSYGEGLPRVLLEAAAVGRPIVATDVPGCRDVVVDGETGYLVPVRDAAALADAIEKLLTDKESRKRMGLAGRVRVAEHYSAERINGQYLELYRSFPERKMD